MLTAAQRDEIRAAERDLDAVALQALMSLLDGLSGRDLDDYLDGLRAGLPALIADHGASSAEIAVTAYDLSREQAGLSRYLAAPVVSAADEQIQRVISWAVAPMFRPPPVIPVDLSDLQVDPHEQVQQRLEDRTPRLVRQSGRETTVTNVYRDPARPRYMRVPRAGSCGFCLMLASRGAVYATEAMATTVGGGTHRHSRNRLSGSSYHDHCRCRPEPIWPGQAEPPEVRAYYEDFKANTKGLRGLAAVRAYDNYVARVPAS